MPSIQSIFAGVALTGFALLQCAAGTPLPSKPCPTPTLPVNGGPTELAGTTLTLSKVTIGRGVQNYTCTAAGAAPVAIGAIATLYDGTELAKRDPALFHTVSALAVYKPLPAAKKPLVLGGAIGSLPAIGNHYFDAAGTPVFDLSSGSTKSIIFANKTQAIKAPASADKGPAGTGAVDWLLLNLKAGYTSVGIKQVYRVVTAGGVGVCTEAGVKSVQYSTEYFLYK